MNETLLMVIYLLLIAFIIIAIIIGLKFIQTLNKVNVLVDDVSEKVKAFNKLFEVINFANERMSMISEVVISFLTSGFKKIFKPKKSSKKINKEDEENE